MNEHIQCGWITIDGATCRPQLVRCKNSWEHLVFFSCPNPQLTFHLNDCITDCVILVPRNVPSPLSPYTGRSYSGGKVLLFRSDGGLGKVDASPGLELQPLKHQVFTVFLIKGLTDITGNCWALLAMETIWFFYSDLECYRTQPLIVKSLKPLAELALLWPWRQQV